MQFTKKFYEDNLKGYKDAATYDLENTWAKDDEFFLELAKSTKGKVLDVACGTGRLTIAIHKCGIEVTGLDIIPEMLALAKQKSEGLNINWIESDCRNFDLGETFDLILMTSHGFQYMLTEEDQNNLFKAVNLHLNENGLFTFDTRNIQKKEYGSFKRTADGELKLWKKYANSENETIHLSFSTTYNEQTQLDHIVFKTENVDAKEVEISEEYLRYTDQQIINGLLKQNGLTVVNQYGYWDKRLIKLLCFHSISFLHKILILLSVFKKYEAKHKAIFIFICSNSFYRMP